MQNPFTAYTLKVSILTIAIACLGMGYFSFIAKQNPFQAFYFIIVVFYATSLIVYYLLDRLTNSNPKRFIQYYTLFSGLKLIFYSLCLIVMFFAWRPDAVKIAFMFGICYALFTGLEIFSVLKTLR